MKQYKRHPDASLLVRYAFRGEDQHIALYFAGEPRRSRQLQKHLNNCATCKSLVDGLKQLAKNPNRCLTKEDWGAYLGCMVNIKPIEQHIAQCPKCRSFRATVETVAEVFISGTMK